MTPAEFKKKWAKFSGKETSAYQSHFDDLCRMLGLPTPIEADPTGDEWFCFQKGVIKDAELVGLDLGEDGVRPVKKGFADVWRKDCFGWEYKGLHKNLDEAEAQLKRYREALLNPPLLVMCDFDRFIIKTNFNGTAPDTHEFRNAQIDDPKILRLLRNIFTEPYFLKPQRTTAEVTEKLAGQIAEVAKSLQKRESRELADARTRAELNFSQRKNLRIARFLNRVVFCFFAEDTGLLPKKLFSELIKAGLDDPAHFAVTLENLFAVMAVGGTFGVHKIRHFNGHLFEESTVFELTAGEMRALGEAAEAEWQFIEPSIMGTLFERALEPEQRSQLGAHYTSESDIKTVIEPVLMAPLRREWAALKASLLPSLKRGQGTAAERARTEAFLKKLRSVIVLDPACGSGNFLYVALQLLLGLEKEVITCGVQLGFKPAPQVSVQQLRAIEVNPYAYELAQVSVQIGFLQWRRDNGFPNDRTPVLQNLDGFQNEDALLVPHFRSKAKTLKDAQAGEHTGDSALKFYTEREWPKCDVIVGNPPFLGGSKLWEELGRDYQTELWRIYEGRVPGFADLCCYWFEKARKLIADGKCQRAGLLATQAIRGGASREVLKRVKETGGIFFAESDRDWILAGANVHVSMIGFDDGTEETRTLDGKPVAVIHANLTANTDVTVAKTLAENLDISFRGTQKSGDFDVPDALALEWLPVPNPHGKPNSDLLKPWLNGSAIVKRMPPVWIIDTGTDLKAGEFALYQRPHAHALRHIKPQRDENKREHRRLNWWLHAETCPGMRAAVNGHERFLSTPRVSKFRIFSWADAIVLPDDGIYIFARSDDYFFGIMHSLLHEVWARANGTQVRERESGFRYTPNTCFETFPFPFADDTAQDALQYVAKLRAAHYHTDQSNVLREDPPPTTPNEHRAAIAAAAKELNGYRERWLNPPEWTQTHTLTFPGTAAGPWARYVDRQSVDPKTGVGTIRYPRLEPRDAECAAELKKRTLTNLYNERPAWLDFAHEKLNATVAAAYGWPADMNDDETLARLLALNHERSATETATTKAPARKRMTREKNENELL